MKISMGKLTTVGRTLFSIALIGFGIENFIFREFLPGRAPAWPEFLPGETAWAYLTGVVFIAIGAAILSQKKARLAAIVAGILIFLWAFLRQIPVVASDSFLSPAWTQAAKALAYSGGAFAIVLCKIPFRGWQDAIYIARKRNNDNC